VGATNNESVVKQHIGCCWDGWDI